MTHPTSILSRVPHETFTSRYANPTHPAASGSLISFVSGGKLIPAPNSRGLIGGISSVVGQAARGETQGAEWSLNPETGLPNSHPYSEVNTRRYENRNRYSRHYGGRRRWGVGGRGDGVVGGPRKMLKKNILYLMVVNMPSDEEMAAAKAMLQH